MTRQQSLLDQPPHPGPQSLPDWVPLSSPGHNQPLVPRVERLARKVRASAAQVQVSVDLPFELLYRPERVGLGFTLNPSDEARRSAWALIGEWLVATAVGALGATDGYAAAHEWFWRGSGRELGTVPDLALSLSVTDPIELRALMPYLLDPMAAATRRDLLNEQSTAHERAARKSAGVYYTPGDVAHLMVARIAAAGHASDEHLWIDPAHGSGVFLRAVLAAIYDEPRARERIYGVDLDPIAAETTSFVLTAEDLVRSPDGPPPWQRWHGFRRNLATGDALLIDASSVSNQPIPVFENNNRSADGYPLGQFEPWRLQEAFPETAEAGFARVVTNPPYAPLKQNAAGAYLVGLHPVTGPSARQDISPMFVELSVDLLPDDGALAIVLPLSVVSSTRSPFPELRTLLANQSGWLELLSFDRAPDALFGDDIKTRNAIVHLDKNAPPNLTTSPLYRWTSRTRDEALADIPTTSITGLPGVPRSIPKIGCDWERDLLLACMNQSKFLQHWYIRRQLEPLTDIDRPVGEQQSDVIAMAPTAYNFLGVMRDPYQAVIDGHDSQNGFSILHFDSKLRASAAYALLSSRLAFWLWHIAGDGFHVTGALHARVPVPHGDGSRIDRLAALGDQLWKATMEWPLVSKNRGRTTVAYPTWPHSGLIDEIDTEVGALVGVDYRRPMASWYEQLVVVDLDSKRRNSIQRKTQ